jgi:hypothetical protein
MADEARLKAAFLSKFPGFVDWPPSVWAHDTLVLCVTSPGPVQSHLQDLTRGEPLRGKSVAVRVLKPDQDPSACHVLFLSADSALGRDRLLARVATLPVLTVSDDPAVFERGGIILLHSVGQRMRFTIDARAADRCGLRLSSQLLGLAADVRGVPR